MEEKLFKCLSENHKGVDSILFCIICKIYMCNKCEKLHSWLFHNHPQIKIDNKNNQDFFTGLCPEKNHKNELNFFCKNHNKLCCIFCLSKIKNKETGQHSDCDVCYIEDIENEKKDKLEENIKILEELSKIFERSINELKLSISKFNENK